MLQKISVVRKDGAIERHAADVGFQHRRNRVLPDAIRRLQCDLPMFAAIATVQILGQASEHGAVVHVMPIRDLAPAIHPAIRLKEQAARHAPLAPIIAPEVVFGAFRAALQDRIIHRRTGNGEPCFDIWIPRAQRGKVQRGGVLSLSR